MRKKVCLKLFAVFFGVYLKSLKWLVTSIKTNNLKKNPHNTKTQNFHLYSCIVYILETSIQEVVQFN